MMAPAPIASAYANGCRSGRRWCRADVVPRLRVHRRLVQCESVKPKDFFPGQLIGGAPAHDRQHIALLDQRASLRPNPATCVQMDHAQPSVSYSDPLLGASAASITRRVLVLSRSSAGGLTHQATSYLMRTICKTHPFPRDKVWPRPLELGLG
jgi:hypothetical protein